MQNLNMTASPSHRISFPGQGSQAVGMGKELAEKYPVARQTFEEADEALGYKLSQLCFEGPEEKLRMTEITQPAILTASVAAWRVLREKGVKPELCRRTQSGRILRPCGGGDAQFLRCGAHRAQPRQIYAGSGSGGSGRHGCDSGDGSGEGHGAFARMPRRAKFASPPTSILPEQIVISGHAAAVERATKLASERGAKRAIMLSVSAPFHCSLMKPAQDRLAADLQSLQFRKAGEFRWYATWMRR